MRPQERIQLIGEYPKYTSFNLPLTLTQISEWLHWLVVNIPAAGGEIGQGKVLTQYQGPSPPSGSGEP